MITVTHELDVCEDCHMRVAGCSARELGAAHHNEEGWRIGMREFRGFQLVNGDIEHYVEFTSRPCNLCGSWQAGSRHRVNVLSR